MDRPVASARPSGLRTAVFAVLAVLVALALVFGGTKTKDAGSPWGRLYRHAGDNYARLFYLASSTGPRTLRGDPLLRQSLDYYDLSARIDRGDRLTRLCRALVLASLGRTKESEELLRDALRQEREERGRAQVRAVAVAVGTAYPSAAQIKAVQQEVGDLVPGPAFVASLYLANGDQERAGQALLVGRERADSLIAPLVAAGVVWVVILGAGLVGLVLLLVNRGRRRRAPAVPAQWGLREGIEALILFFVIQLAASVVLLPWPQLMQRQPFMLLVPNVIGVLGAVAWVRLVVPGARDLGWRTSRVWRQLAAGISAGGVVVALILVIGYIIRNLTGQSLSEHPVVPFFTEAPTWPARLSLALGIVVVAPVLEETIFRGILYGALRRRWSVGVAITVSALIFALGHPHAGAIGLGPFIIGLVPYVAIGAVLAWLYERTGSLVAPAAAHGAFNLLNVAALLVLFR